MGLFNDKFPLSEISTTASFSHTLVPELSQVENSCPFGGVSSNKHHKTMTGGAECTTNTVQKSKCNHQSENNQNEAEEKPMDLAPNTLLHF